MTLTDDQYEAIDRFLASHRLPAGLGSKDEACSIASINLALRGMLTDEIPECMSEVVGKWIIGVQDAMPDALRNSTDWKILLSSAAGTGRFREAERLDIVLEWMWGTVLPTVQPVADRYGFGGEWKAMCDLRTRDAALVAKTAAYTAATTRESAATAAAATAAYTAATTRESAATAAAATAAYTAATTRESTATAAYAAAAYTAAAAATTAYAAATTAYAATTAFWETVDPCSLLAKLIAVGV